MQPNPRFQAVFNELPRTEVPILNTILWALLTGGLTGGAWVGIVLLSRQRHLSAQHQELLEDRQRTLDELERISTRLIEVEDRLDFAERRLARPSDTPGT